LKLELELFEVGVWLGFRNIIWFAQVLSAKSLLRGLFGSGLWSKVIIKKYLKENDVVF